MASMPKPMLDSDSRIDPMQRPYERGYAAGQEAERAKYEALMKPLKEFVEDFLRNAPILQEQIGRYSLALESLKMGAEEALRQLGTP